MSVSSPAALLSHHSVPDSRTLFLLLGSVLPRLTDTLRGQLGGKGPNWQVGARLSRDVINLNQNPPFRCD